MNYLIHEGKPDKFTGDPSGKVVEVQQNKKLRQITIVVNINRPDFMFALAKEYVKDGTTVILKAEGADNA